MKLFSDLFERLMSLFTLENLFEILKGFCDRDRQLGVRLIHASHLSQLCKQLLVRSILRLFSQSLSPCLRLALG